MALVRRHALLALVALGIVTLAVTGCSAGAGGGISVTGAWSRPSPTMTGAGAAYLIIENIGSAPDVLTGGSSPLAKAVEVHQTVEMGSLEPGASAGQGGGGMLGMQKVDRLEVPAGGRVELKAGGYHLMLIGLTRELTVGETIEITLRFERAGEVKVSAEVRAG